MAQIGLLNNAHKEKLVYIIQLITKTFHSQNIIRSDYKIMYRENNYSKNLIKIKSTNLIPQEKPYIYRKYAREIQSML